MRRFNRLTAATLSAALIISSASYGIWAESNALEATESVDSEQTMVLNSGSSSVQDISYSFEGKSTAMTMNLVWDYVSDAATYSVRVIKHDDSGDTEVFNKEVNTNSVTLDSLINESYSYTYEITANNSNGVTIGGTATGSIKMPSFGEVPAALTAGLTEAGKDYITLNWETPQNIDLSDKYYIYMGTSKTKINTLLGAVDQNETTFTFKMKEDGKHYYSLRTYSDDYNATSAYREVRHTYTSPMLGTTVHTSFKWVVTTTKSAKLYKSSTGSSYYKSVAKGTTGTPIDKYPSKIIGWDYPTRIKVKLTSGGTGWIPFGSLDFDAQVKSHNKYDYSTAVKQAFVKNYSSSTKYLIWVNRYSQHTYIFTGKKGSWKLIHTYVCTTGNYYQPTKGGTGYKTNGHRSKVIKVHRNGQLYYFTTSTSFGGTGTFHTRCRWVSNNNYRNAINVHPSTKGCVRLYDDAAKYIYDLPLGTRVLIQ